ncbi:MAG: sulfatase [Planctomycetota bacterium]
MTTDPARRPEARAARAAASVALALCFACSGSADDAPRMNVLLVTLDTTRPDRMSCYGGAPGLTPTLDALAAEGTRFERAVSTAGITPMSHASILTGLNNFTHGMRVFYSPDVSHRLKDVVDTFPEVLQRQGYRTAARVSSYPVSAHYGLDQGFDDFESGVDVDALDLEAQQSHSTSWDTGGRSNTQRRGDFTTDSALAWLDANGEAGPWCLWLHMFDVHDYSLVPPAAFARERGIEYPGPGTRLSPSDRVQWRERMYDPELAFMDAQLGRVIAWLRESGQLERTVVVVTADHGQGLSDGLRRHGWMKHRLLYDWSVRVPLIVRVPGIGGGAVVDSQVRTIDIAPTVVDALRVGVRQPMEGDSLLRLMRGEADDAPRVAYADALNDYDAHAPPPERLPPGQYDNLYMACDGRWKLIWHERNPDASQLYDLLKDPDELENLYRTDHPRVAPLMQYLTDRRVWDVEPPGSGSVAPDVGRLRELGYIGAEPEDTAPEDTVPAGTVPGNAPPVDDGAGPPAAGRTDGGDAVRGGR